MIGPACCRSVGGSIRQAWPSEPGACVTAGHLPMTSLGLAQERKSTSEGGAVTTLELPVAFQEQG